MKHAKDLFGFVLLLAGVGGIFSGVHAVSADTWWGGPALGAGAAANVIAYRLLRPSSKREGEPDAS